MLDPLLRAECEESLEGARIRVDVSYLDAQPGLLPAEVLLDPADVLPPLKSNRPDSGPVVR